MKTEVDGIKKQNDKIYTELLSFKQDLDARLTNIDKLGNKFEQISTKIDELENKFENINQIMEYEPKKLTKRDFMIHRLAWSKDQDCQYNRRENIRIFGIPEFENEDVRQLVVDVAQKMGVSIDMRDISTCHRLGGFNRPRDQGDIPLPRAIIVKFVRRDIKYEIMKNRKYLGNRKAHQLKDGEYNIYVNEDLTPLRNKIKRILEKEHDISEVWTHDGKIMCMQTINGKPYKRRIDTPEDLIRELGWSFSRLDLLGLTVDSSPFEAPYDGFEEEIEYGPRKG